MQLKLKCVLLSKNKRKGKMHSVMYIYKFTNLHNKFILKATYHINSLPIFD